MVSSRPRQGHVEEWRGLYAPDGSPRPAATAYQTTVSLLDGFAAAERLTMPQGVWAYRFTFADGHAVTVLWAEDGMQTTVALPGVEGEVTLADWDGTASSADASALSVTGSPVFVWQ